MTGRLVFICAAFSFLLAACQGMPQFQRGPASGAPNVLVPQADTIRPQPRPTQTSAVVLGRGALTPDALDQTSAAERAAATAPPSARTQLLGDTLASLGSPTEAGFWLRTGLVTRVSQGRVETTDGSKSVRVELRPSGAQAGAGSQLSLAAFRALDLPLTQLVTLRVFGE